MVVVVILQLAIAAVFTRPLSPLHPISIKIMLEYAPTYVTSVASLVSIITGLSFGVGKLWAIFGFGLIHNVVEVYRSCAIP
ncbi:hypothetical protein RCL_jg19755.t1 [Rhizophagus clarus]|uniref:SLC26A/SulP transporter domain-containing protein n=1 Tax=Rhizophagus clarus TaxID=94130 RepID=A0A8H3MAK2_9GLOM|nr:hypothetical protein RCL_jg19755.t1 [Rhizophagus clarus]